MALTQTTLRPDDDAHALVPVSVLRKILVPGRGSPFSAVAIGKFVDEGMPVAGSTPKGYRRFDVNHCRAWYASRMTGTGHGGPRANSGRPPATPPALTTQTDPATEPGSLVAGHVSTTTTLNPDDFDTPEKIAAARQSLSAVQAKILESLLKSERTKMEMDVARGKLVDRDEAAGSIGRHLAEVRRVLDGAPARIASQLRDALGLDAARTAAARRVIEDVIRTTERALAEDPMGELGAERAAAA